MRVGLLNQHLDHLANEQLSPMSSSSQNPGNNQAGGDFGITGGSRFNQARGQESLFE